MLHSTQTRCFKCRKYTSTGKVRSNHNQTNVLSNKHTEHSVAADLIDRALFAYERAFVGSFNFTGGNNRLDFDRVENRPFFLALHRQATYVRYFNPVFVLTPPLVIYIDVVVSELRSNLRKSSIASTRLPIRTGPCCISISLRLKPACINGYSIYGTPIPISVGRNGTTESTCEHCQDGRTPVRWHSLFRRRRKETV